MDERPANHLPETQNYITFPDGQRMRKTGHFIHYSELLMMHEARLSACAEYGLLQEECRKLDIRDKTSRTQNKTLRKTNDQLTSDFAKLRYEHDRRYDEMQILVSAHKKPKSFANVRVMYPSPVLKEEQPVIHLDMDEPATQGLPATRHIDIHTGAKLVRVNNRRAKR
jgi:hypothetical protein